MNKKEEEEEEEIRTEMTWVCVTETVGRRPKRLANKPLGLENDYIIIIIINLFFEFKILNRVDIWILNYRLLTMLLIIPPKIALRIGKRTGRPCCLSSKSKSKMVSDVSSACRTWRLDDSITCHRGAMTICPDGNLATAVGSTLFRQIYNLQICYWRRIMSLG